MRTPTLPTGLLAIALLAGGCLGGPAPAAPPVTKPPELIPLDRFFANREANWGYRVSPDGTRLGWITSHQGRTTVFFKYVGDPSRPEDRARLEAKSPLFKVDRVQRPILIIHGANDARVKVSESEQMVAALRRAGKDVRYVVFPDEGHRRDYGNWRNAIRHYREIELFLSGCLGGRTTASP